MRRWLWLVMWTGLGCDGGPKQKTPEQVPEKPAWAGPLEAASCTGGSYWCALARHPEGTGDWPKALVAPGVSVMISPDGGVDLERARPRFLVMSARGEARFAQLEGPGPKAPKDKEWGLGLVYQVEEAARGKRQEIALNATGLATELRARPQRLKQRVARDGNRWTILGPCRVDLWRAPRGWAAVEWLEPREECGGRDGFRVSYFPEARWVERAKARGPKLDKIRRMAGCPKAPVCQALDAWEAASDPVAGGAWEGALTAARAEQPAMTLSVEVATAETGVRVKARAGEVTWAGEAPQGATEIRARGGAKGGALPGEPLVLLLRWSGDQAVVLVQAPLSGFVWSGSLLKK